MGRTKKIYTFDEINADADRIDQAQRIAKSVKEAMARPFVESLEDTIDQKDIEIMELKHQIVGYKAVISYLEHQLGLGKSQ
jgi:tRNA A37 N6-isopentenylltransferase MiaA